MKVVLVSRFPAFPSTAGNRSRIRQLAQAIQGLGHELRFVLLASKWEASDDAAHEAAFGKGNFIRVGQGSWLARWMRDVAKGGVKRILRAAGVEAAYYSPLDRLCDRRALAELSRLDLRADAVVVEYVLDSWAFQAFPGVARRVLDTHDAFGNRHKDYIARGVTDYWISLRPQSENEGFRRAHVLLAIQQDEAERFRRQLAGDPKGGDPEVAVVSHLLELRAGRVDYGVDASATFLASDNSANRHAIGAFLGHVLPRVVREIPHFDLRLAGSICKAVPDMPNVTRLGWVGDVHEVFARSPLSVNPVVLGTGINIKLLDAMASGVATVSTTTGLRGLPPSYRRGIVAVADDDAPAFADAIVRLARDAGLREDLGRAALEDAHRWHREQLAELGRCLGTVER